MMGLEPKAKKPSANEKQMINGETISTDSGAVGNHGEGWWGPLGRPKNKNHQKPYNNLLVKNFIFRALFSRPLLVNC